MEGSSREAAGMSRRGVAYIVIANVLAGSVYMVTAQALQGFSPVALVFWRTVVAAAVLLPAILSDGSYGRAHWLRLIIAGFLGYGAALIFATEGLRLCGPTTAGLLIGVQPLAVVLLSALLLKESLEARKVAAVFLGIAGAIVLLGVGGSVSVRLFDSHSRGILLMMLYAVFGALLPVLAKATLDQVSPLAFTGLTALLALGPIFGAAWPRFGALGLPSSSSWNAWIAMLYLAVVGTIACTFLGCRALLYMPASETAPYFFLQPLVGTFLSAVWEGRFPTAQELAGGGLILAGAGLILGKKDKKP